MSAHTPGPWGVRIVEDGSDRRTARWLVTAKSLVLAETKVLPPTLDVEAEANAKLIAAAPDLLAALKLADEFTRAVTLANSDGSDPGGDGDWFAMREALEAAIAKAEGQS